MAHDDKVEATGLAGNAESEYPRFSDYDSGEAPIDRLKPGSDAHRRVLDYLVTRLQDGERSMTQFYDRWTAAERRSQAYVNLQDWEKILKEQNDNGYSPKVVDIRIPYSYATKSSIVTYMLHTFFGRKPIFQIGSYKKESAEAAPMMEMVLQYNADHSRLIKHGNQFFDDGEMYGVGIFLNLWKNDRKMRTVWTEQPNFSFLGSMFGSRKVKIKEERLVYSGNDISTIDPFMFFPDPRVPMHEVNKRGEFVFWRQFVGKHSLLQDQAAGVFKWVEHASKGIPRNENKFMESSRNILSNGQSHPGSDIGDIITKSLDQYSQLDRGSVEIIPAELGLGSSKVPQKWLFSILNKAQVIEARPLDMDHGMHPVAVGEPNTMGYGFGAPGLLDYLGPLEDTQSWFVNSHIQNVRTALNNMFIVDPGAIEMQDFLNPEAGLMIRLKRSAMGRDVRSVIQQLNVVDVTQSHIQDLAMIMKIGDALSGVNDNLRGIQDSGGRKTATEVRTSGEAGASRLAAKARLLSAQAFVDLTEQMSINNQQYLEEDFYLDLVGAEGARKPIHISPDMLIGDFNYPVNDGTLPIDRVAMLDVWKELFTVVLQDQELRATYSIPNLFAKVAELGGVKNLDNYKVNVQAMPQQALDQQVQAGNVVSINELTGGGGGPQSGTTPGIPGAPRERLNQ